MEKAEAFCLDQAPRHPAIIQQWIDLAHDCPWATPFQKPQWLLPWCHHFTPYRQWWMGLRQQERLIALAPLFCYHQGENRVVTQIGAGLSDRLDMLVRPGWRHAAEKMLIDGLWQQRSHWDVCDFQELSGTCPLATLALPQGAHSAVQIQARCPVLIRTRSGTFPVPPEHDAKAARAVRRLRREGPLHLERAPTNGGHTLFKELKRLHQLRWSGPNRTGGLFKNATLSAFHDDVVAAFSSAQKLGLYGLRVDGLLIAAVYLLEEERTAYFYACGFHPRWSRFSPMIALLKLVIDDYRTRGFERLDFLRGQEPYKYWWGADDVINWRRRWHSPWRRVQRPANAR